MIPNRRQISFAKLAKLFSAVVLDVPLDVTDKEQTEVAKILNKEFTKIMGEYDRSRR